MRSSTPLTSNQVDEISWFFEARRARVSEPSPALVGVA
jgi:hypothetical protein